MIRILFSLCFWVIIARWSYAEIKLLLPSAVPVIDYALDTIQIPTHDKWNAQTVDRFIAKAETKRQESIAALHSGTGERTSEAFKQVGDTVKRYSAEAKAFVKF